MDDDGGLRRSDDSIARELDAALFISRKRAVSDRDDDFDAFEDEREFSDSRDNVLMSQASPHREAPRKRARLEEREEGGVPDEFCQLNLNPSHSFLVDRDLSEVAGGDGGAGRKSQQEAGPRRLGSADSPRPRAARRRRVPVAAQPAAGGSDFAALMASCTHPVVFGPFPRIHMLERVIVTVAPAVLRTGTQGMVALASGSVLKADGWAILPGGQGTRLYSVIHLSDIVGTRHSHAVDAVDGQNSTLTEGVLEPDADLCTVRLSRCTECKSWVPHMAA